MHINLASACISFSLILWNRDTVAQNVDDETILINPEAFGCFGTLRNVTYVYSLPLINYSCISFTIAFTTYGRTLNNCQLSLINISIELKLPSKEVIVGLNRSISDAIDEKFPILKPIKRGGFNVDGWLEKEGNDYYVFSLTDLSVKRLNDSDVLADRFGFCSYSAACKPPVINESAWMPSCGDGKERLYDYKQQIPCNCTSGYNLPRDQYSAECSLNGWRIPVCQSSTVAGQSTASTVAQQSTSSTVAQQSTSSTVAQQSTSSTVAQQSTSSTVAQQSTSSTVARLITAATEVLGFTTGEQNANTATNEQSLSATPGSAQTTRQQSVTASNYTITPLCHTCDQSSSSTKVTPLIITEIWLVNVIKAVFNQKLQ